MYTIKKETRKNQAADFFNSFWPDQPTAKNYDVFVRDYSPKGDILEVDCDFIARKYGEATIENAQKFFDKRDAEHDAEEKEILEADCA